MRKKKFAKGSRRKNLLKKSHLTKKEYKQLRGMASRKFKIQNLTLKDKNFEVQIYKIVRIKKGGKRTIQISASEFVKGQDYEVYIRHKPTRQRRLLAIGKLYDIPIRTKQLERFGYQLGGRTFDASLKYPRKAKGRWIPVNRIVRDIQKELEMIGSDFKTEIRASIIPLKRYFHSKWKIYADEPIKGSKLIKKCFVHCAVRFVYPNNDWIGKQSIFLEFNRRVRIDKVYQLRERLETRINQDLELLHPQADNVSLIEVNGFIPLGI